MNNKTYQNKNPILLKKRKEYVYVFKQKGLISNSALPSPLAPVWYRLDCPHCLGLVPVSLHLCRLQPEYIIII